MTRQQQQRANTGEMRRGLVPVFVAAVLLATLSLCLARADVATASSLGPLWEKGAVTAVGEAGAGQEMTLAEGRGAELHERMDREVSINDYPDSGPNRRHNPTHP